jgi:hypothetical protein
MKCPLTKLTNYEYHESQDGGINLTYENFQDCLKKDCAWWVVADKKNGICAIHTMALALVRKAVNSPT